MKKALIVLLLLAFVAGGLFAQFSFAGHVDAGLALSVLEGVDDAQLGVIGKAGGINGGRVQLQTSYTNEAKNAGMVLRLRFVGMGNTPTDPAAAANIQVRAGFGWLKFFNGALTVYGGRLGASGALFSTFDPLSDGANLYDNTTGLLAVVKPVDMFSIGFAATLPRATGFTGVNFIKGQGTVVLGVAVPDIMNINAHFAFSQQAANLNGNIRAFLSFDVTAIKNFKIQLTMQMFGLQDFKAAGSMIFSEYFAFNGIKNLSLNLGFQEGVTGADGDDLFFKTWLWAAYALADGKIVPRLDFMFAIGSNGNTGDGLYLNGWYGMPTAPSKDAKSLGLIPSVQFRIGGSNLEIGYALNAFLGDAWDGANHHIFINLLTSF